MSKFEIEEVGHVIILHISGDLQSKNMEEFENCCLKIFASNPEIMAINMKYITMIDSISLNHLFKLSKKLDEKDIDFVIYDVSPKVSEILEIIKFDVIVPLVTKKEFEKDYLKAC